MPFWRVENRSSGGEILSRSYHDRLELQVQETCSECRPLRKVSNRFHILSTFLRSSNTHHPHKSFVLHTSLLINCAFSFTYPSYSSVKSFSNLQNAFKIKTARFYSWFLTESFSFRRVYSASKSLPVLFSVVLPPPDLPPLCLSTIGSPITLSILSK